MNFAKFRKIQNNIVKISCFAKFLKCCSAATLTIGDWIRTGDATVRLKPGVHCATNELHTSLTSFTNPLCLGGGGEGRDTVPIEILVLKFVICHTVLQCALAIRLGII